MNDYIKRESAIQVLYEEDNPLDMELSLNCIPAEDVSPVKHGKWIYDKDGWLICNLCTFHPSYSLNRKDKKGLSNCNYCPNCGAKMK